MEKIKKVLFVNPPMIFYSDDDTVRGNAPIRPNVSLPALILLGELKKAGFERSFIDMTVDGKEKYKRIREKMMSLGMGFEELSARVLEIRPDAVLISSMFTMNLEMVERAAEAVKNALPSVTVIVGGSFASEKPGWHLESGNVDFVVTGEGERSVVNLLRELNNTAPDMGSVKGLAYRKGGEIVVNPAYRTGEYNPSFDYETVLFRENGEYRYPERATRKSETYSHGIPDKERACVFYGSRGCPMGCMYCSSFSREGKAVRHMGGERLFEQIKLLHEKYNVNVFYNQSDSFCLHPEDIKFLRLVAEYRKKHPTVVINNPNAFFVRIFFRGGKVDESFIHLLKEAGINVVTLAIETFNQRFNRKIDFSEITFERIAGLCRRLREEGMKIDTYLMYGFPGETMQEIENDLQKADQLKGLVDEISWANLIIFPGCEYYRKALEEGLFDEREYRKRIMEGYSFRRINDFFNLTEIPTEKLNEIFRLR